MPQQHLPRYFAKSGHVDSDPKKIKKNGAGKGGWLVPQNYRGNIFEGSHVHPGVSMERKSKTRASTSPMPVAAPTAAAILLA